MLYRYLNADILSKELENNRHLYARWNFDRASGALLYDANADCTAVLRGNPAFVKDGDRRVMTLNGRDQYALIEPHAADATALTFDIIVKPATSELNQVLFDFSGPDTSLSFAPRDANGRSTFSIRKGATVQTVSAPPLAAGRWTRVTLSLGGGKANIFLEGKLAASTPMSLVPGDLGFIAGYLGRRGTGDSFYAGAIDEFAICRRAIADTGELPELWKTPADWRVKGGTWTLDAGVFRQSDASAKQTILFLPGSERWGDYTVTLQARRIAGPNAYRLHFRARSPEKSWVVDFGQEGRGTAIKENGVTFGGPNYFVVPNWEQWQDIRLEVKGSKVTVDLAGKKVTETSKPIEPATGGFALGTRESSAEFRNIRVIRPDGKVLFESMAVK